MPDLAWPVNNAFTADISFAAINQGIIVICCTGRWSSNSRGRITPGGNSLVQNNARL